MSFLQTFIWQGAIRHARQHQDHRPIWPLPTPFLTDQEGASLRNWWLYITKLKQYRISIYCLCIYIYPHIYIYILYMSKQHVIYLYVYNIISYEIDTSHEACQIRVFHVVGWYRNYFVRMIQHHNCLNSNLQVDQRNTESVYIKKSKEKDTLLCSTKMLIPMYHIKNSQLMK